MIPDYNQIQEKIKTFNSLEKESHTLITQKGNSFFVYNIFRIEKNKNSFNIYYIDQEEFVTTVYTSASAISYCNAMKAEDVQLADKIIKTDRKLEYITNDIIQTKIRLKNKSLKKVVKSVMLSRLSDYIFKQQQLKMKLHKYIQLSKEIKSKGFINEFTTVINSRHGTRVR